MSAKAYDEKTAAFGGYLIQNVPPLGSDEMNAWMQDPEGLKEFLAGLKSPPLFIDVDYDAFLFEDEVAAGKFDWRNPDLNKRNFPVKGESRKRFACKLFPADCSSETGVKRIEADGFRSGATEHIIKFGAKFPRLQFKHPIVGLGSAARVGGGVVVPCLDRSDAERLLDLNRWDSGWPDLWRLLGVREVSAPAA